MTQNEIRAAVLSSLKSVAPETDPSTLDGKVDFRDELDIDSMDFLKFVRSLHATLQVDVPERDYPKVRSVDGCVAYLDAKLTKPG